MNYQCYLILELDCNRKEAKRPYSCPTLLANNCHKESSLYLERLWQAIVHVTKWETNVESVNQKEFRLGYPEKIWK